MDHSLKNADANFGCTEHLAQHLFPRPAGAFATAVKIESGRAEFRIGVTGQVGFSEQGEPADASGLRKLHPGNFPNDAKIEMAYHAIKNCAQAFEIGERFAVATARIDEPFSAECHFSRATVYPKRIVWRHSDV